jgi:hypothetical protein
LVRASAKIPSPKANSRRRCGGDGYRLYVGDLRLIWPFANIAVAINVAMIFGILSLLNATLTLPVSPVLSSLSGSLSIQRAYL